MYVYMESEKCSSSSFAAAAAAAAAASACENELKKNANIENANSIQENTEKAATTT